jgi:RNA-directed DNA polymerase
VIAEINPILRGWGNYFRTGKPRQGVPPDRPLRPAAIAWPDAKTLRPQPSPRPVERLDARVVQANGLYRLRGTIRYPKAAS